MTDTIAAPPAPSVTDIRRALVAEAADFDERRQTHQANMHTDGTHRCDAYEGLARASAYGLLLAGVLGQLNQRPGLHDVAAGLADVVEDVMAHGTRALADVNADLHIPGPSETRIGNTGRRETIYHASREGEPNWDGDNIYSTLLTAQLSSMTHYGHEQWPDGIQDGKLVWRHTHGIWDLLHDDKTTGIIVQERKVLANCPGQAEAVAA